MGRPKLIQITADQLLSAVVARYRATLAQIDAERAVAQSVVDRTHPDWEALWQTKGGTELWLLDRERKSLTEGDGLTYDLPGFVGRQITPSERIVAQKLLRGLESQGLVVIFGQHARYIRPTEAGLAAVEPAHA